ncbi:hypothetical protein NFI96_004309 [Prochilodus magdalenae]|nr:hypothetical protein NFI96_004309 [Prochilodus magdalenae]
MQWQTKEILQMGPSGKLTFGTQGTLMHTEEKLIKLFEEPRSDCQTVIRFTDNAALSVKDLMSICPQNLVEAPMSPKSRLPWLTDDMAEMDVKEMKMSTDILHHGQLCHLSIYHASCLVKDLALEDLPPLKRRKEATKKVGSHCLAQDIYACMYQRVRKKSTLYKAVRGSCLILMSLKWLKLIGTFLADIAPLITTMAISADVPLVESAFRKVQEGSPISYQHPVPVNPDAPPPPPLPVDGYKLEPTSCQFVYSLQQQLHLQTTFDMARKIEVATREQCVSVEWHQVRKNRVTSFHFAMSAVGSSAEHLAERIRKGVAQTALMKRGLTLERDALQEYCRVKNTNYWPCGFVIHPDGPWLGSSPDGVVFNPTEKPHFGLLEIKCQKLC